MMGFIKKAALTGVALLGIIGGAVYGDMEYVNHARLKKEKPHSSFLESAAKKWDYYAEYMSERYLGERLSVLTDEEIVSGTRNRLWLRHSEIIPGDIEYLLTNDNKLLAERSLEVFVHFKDERIAPYLVEDLQKVDRRFSDHVDILRSIEADKDPEIRKLISMEIARQRSRQASERKAREENMLKRLPKRYGKYPSGYYYVTSDNDAKRAMEGLAEMGSERALQVFIEKGDEYAMAIFVNVNYRKGNRIYENYKSQIMPNLVSEIGGSYRGAACLQLIPYGAAIRRLDKQEAELFEKTRSHDLWPYTNCNQIVRDALLGIVPSD